MTTAMITDRYDAATTFFARINRAFDGLGEAERAPLAARWQRILTHLVHAWSHGVPLDADTLTEFRELADDLDGL